MRIRAHVNDVLILDDEVREACLPQLQAVQSQPEPERSRLQKEIIQRQLQALIDRQVILQDFYTRVAAQHPQVLEELKKAAKRDFDKQIRVMKTRLKKSGHVIKSDEELKKFFQAQGLSLDSFRRQEEQKFMAREYIGSRIYGRVNRIGHREIVEYYAQHPNEFQVLDSVKWQDIFIDASKFPSRAAARAFAEQLALRARRGEDFAKLAKYDNGDSIYRHGEGFGTRRGEIKPAEVEPILFQLKDGQVGPVVELGNGFHVIRLIHRVFAGRKPLDAALQNDIRKKLQNEAWDREYKRLLAELKRKASIEIILDAP